MTLNKLVDDFTSVQKVFGILSGDINKLQSLKDLLSRGDNVSSHQVTLNKLVDDFTSVQKVFGILSGDINKLQSLKDLLSRGDNVSSHQVTLNKLVDDLQIHQKQIGDISTNIATLQSLKEKLSRGDYTPQHSKSINSLIVEIKKIQSLVNMYSATITVLQKDINVVSDDSINSFQQQLQTFLENNDTRGYQNITNALQNISSRIYSPSAEIYLDGRPLSRRAYGFRISYNESSVHNEITFSSNDPELFRISDPEIEYGEIRIEAQVGNRMIQFLLDERNGDSSAFSVSGISVSAKEDSPYADDINYSMTEAKLASEIAEELTNFCPVEWEVEDWVVPLSFEFSGKPLDGIQKLAFEIGGIVRCQDDGSLLVRYPMPTRPVDVDSVIADVNYSRSNLIKLNASEEPESGYNAVTILGYVQDIFIPDLQLEEIPEGGGETRQPFIGETCYVRAYWAGRESTISDTDATSGRIEVVGGGNPYSQTEVELLEFKDGVASVNLPCHEILAVDWIGRSGGEISFTQYSKELFIASSGFGICSVKYRTEYQKYVLSGHNVEKLIAILFLTTLPDIYVNVKTMDESKYGSVISAPLLTTASAAVARGIVWIDNNKYRKHLATIEAPYDDNSIDGKLGFINDANIGYQGNYYIVSSDIVIDGPKVTNEMGIKRCLISFN